MPGVGQSDGSTQVQPTSGDLQEDGSGVPGFPPPRRDGSPESRATSAHSRRTDPAGLITDLTKLRQITHDDRVNSPSYRKYIPEFDDPDLPQDEQTNKEQIFSEPTDTIFYGEGFEEKSQAEDVPYDFEKDIVDDDDIEDEFGEDVENVSSIGSDGDFYEEADYDTDLEDAQDSEKVLFGGSPYDHDNSGKSVYLRKCEELGVTPATYFLKHMDDTHLVMKFHGLGPQGMKAIAGQLEVNTIIEKIDLEGNYILGEGAHYLTRVLRENVYVTELVLCDNKIGNAGAKAICELLAENKTIIHLNLSGNDIEDPAGNAFFEMLSRNGDIKTLMLRHNKFEDVGANWFAEAMNENVTLETLDLSWNMFTTKGCVLIADALKDNVGLKYLNCSMNGFAAEGARVLGEALKENKYLLDLDISYCRIPREAAPDLAAGLQANDTLQKLNIGYNPLKEEGGFDILEGLDKATQSVMKRVDFGNLMVRKNFKDLHDKLKEERGLEVLYGGVLLDVVRTRLHDGSRYHNPYAHFMNDPMTKLKDYVEKAGFRMVDLLKSFDRDQSFTISLDELKAGIRRCNIDLTDPQIVQLMNQLDKDGNGEIDFSELLEGNMENILKKREAKKYLQQQGIQAITQAKSDVSPEPKALISSPSTAE